MDNLQLMWFAHIVQAQAELEALKARNAYDAYHGQPPTHGSDDFNSVSAGLHHLIEAIRSS